MPTTTVAEPTTVIGDLTPYNGSWEMPQATHLLRRALFGPKLSEVREALSLGLEETLDRLLAPPVLPDPPVRYLNFDSSGNPINDPFVNFGETYIGKPYANDGETAFYRLHGLRSWYFQTLIDHPFNITDQIALFWYNHFSMSLGDGGDRRMEYDAITLFREKGLESYKEMIDTITTFPLMLRFLNGVDSSAASPNENYARELLELFTIQRGPEVAPGDYTFYTEQDVRAAARILTGWRIRGEQSSQHNEATSFFYADAHDKGSKQLSHRFDNVEIPGDFDIGENGEREYKALIEVIFQKVETARSMCRELYRWFVYYEIDDTIETDIIVPLADHMIANDFSIRETLRLLLSSQHFFDISVRGPQIKNPFELIISLTRPFGGYGHLGLALPDPDDLGAAYSIGGTYNYVCGQMEMAFLFPPTVAGWPAYYQAPGFYRNWVSSSTLQRRRDVINVLTGSGYGGRSLDVLGFMEELSAPFDLDAVVEEITTLFLPRPLTAEQVEGLKVALLDQLPAFEWTIEWSNYQDNLNNAGIVNSMRNRVRSFFRAMCRLAEFQLQ